MSDEPWTPERYNICIEDKAMTCSLPRACLSPCSVVLEIERFQKEKQEVNKEANKCQH